MDGKFRPHSLFLGFEILYNTFKCLGGMCLWMLKAKMYVLRWFKLIFRLLRGAKNENSPFNKESKRIKLKYRLKLQLYHSTKECTIRIMMMRNH
ncbi:hypothetical protein ERO13_D13G206133v2 [Gossypium hirsutum]|nr:hypothetical protein ERO13_D13G206133v2 [Gossypium hirsutum]